MDFSKPELPQIGAMIVSACGFGCAVGAFVFIVGLCVLALGVVWELTVHKVEEIKRK